MDWLVYTPADVLHISFSPQIYLVCGIVQFVSRLDDFAFDFENKKQMRVSCQWVGVFDSCGQGFCDTFLSCTVHLYRLSRFQMACFLSKLICKCECKLLRLVTKYFCTLAEIATVFHC